MKRFFTPILLAVMALFAVACEPDNNDGGNGDKELPVNSYWIFGEPVALQSVALDMLDDNIYIVASPTANLATAEEIFESEEYIFVAVSPLLVGKEFDLKTEQSLYTIMSTLGGAPLKEVTPENNSEVKAGTAKFTYEGGVAVVKASITLTSGREVKLHLSAEKKVEVNDNTIARGDEVKPLRAAFYDEGDYSTTLYFTPAGLEHFGEIDNASWYIYLGVSNRLIDGKAHSLADMDGTSSFEFGVIDNVSSSKTVEIMAGYLRGATGNFTISKTAEATYTASINIKLLGVQYVVEFDDESISVDYAPEKKTNFFDFKGTEYVITSATLTKGESVWSAEFATSSGKSVVLNAPQGFFNSGDSGRGFSQSADFTVEYNGVVYSKAKGYSGTMISTYNEAKQSLVLDFFNNSDVKFNYTGVVEVK
jgi:hypothetical protein